MFGWQVITLTRLLFLIANKPQTSKLYERTEPRATYKKGQRTVVSVAVLHVGRPQGEVVPEQLHDERGVLVALLGEGIELSNGVVEGSLGQAAGAVGRVEDLVVED